MIGRTVASASKTSVISMSESGHNNQTLLVIAKDIYPHEFKMKPTNGEIKLHNLPAYPDNHNMSTNRISEKPSDGAVSNWGQSHDVSNLFISDGSPFVTSTSVDPTLAIVALAIRQAEHIAKFVKTNALYLKNFRGVFEL